MKIGILTFYYGSENYGAVLQAFALNKYLTDKYPEAEVKTISYSFKAQSKYQEWIKNVKSYFYIFLKGNFAFISQKIKFAKFRDSIAHTRFCTPKTLAKVVQDFDVIIAGSDQIWNPNFCGDKNFFLPFEAKTISYAASIGGVSDLKNEQIEFIKDNMKYLQYISVREKSDEIFFSKKISRNITTVLDPTLLLKKSDYMDLLLNIKVKKYSLFYILGDLELYKDVIYKVLRQNECDVKIVMPSYMINKDRIRDNKVKYIEDCGPIDFIRLIAEAKYIYTDSFHATVFSYIFCKQFYTFPKGTMNARIESLLDIVNLKERFINVEDFLKNDFSLSCIDYNNLNNKFFNEKKKSEEWINYVLERV